jgi:hypothetical protein
MLARTEGAIALGPCGNAQGGIKFYTLATGKVVVRRQFKRLPMTDAVIACIGLLAVGQPSHPVVTDRKGRPIGDVAMEHFDYDNSEADDIFQECTSQIQTTLPKSKEWEPSIKILQQMILLI